MLAFISSVRGRAQPACGGIVNRGDIEPNCKPLAYAMASNRQREAMGHTRSGGIGNCAGSYVHARAEVIEELREPIIRSTATATARGRARPAGWQEPLPGDEGALDRNRLKRLEWVAKAKPGAPFCSARRPVIAAGACHVRDGPGRARRDSRLPVQFQPALGGRHGCHQMLAGHWLGRELTQPDHDDLGKS